MDPLLKKEKEERTPLVLKNKGESIFCTFHRPLEVKNPPVVVTLHGFGSNKVGSNRSYVTLATSLSKAGLATLRYDARGCGDSEGSLSQMTPEDYLSDLMTVCSHLQNEGFSRIGLFGSSFG